MSTTIGNTPTVRPSLRRLAAEVVAFATKSRALEFDRMATHALPRGDGHAVLMLPPTFRGDAYTDTARALVTGLGYPAYGWKLGANIGPTARLIDGAARRLKEVYGRHGPVSLVGFSLGGLYARLLAARYPDSVRQVITVCSPIVRPAGSVFIPLEPFLDFWPGVDLRQLAAEVSAALPVPSTCIYSRDDGIVSWSNCCDPNGAIADNVEVKGCHVTMGRNLETLAVLASCLARPTAKQAITRVETQ